MGSIPLLTSVIFVLPLTKLAFNRTYNNTTSCTSRGFNIGVATGCLPPLEIFVSCPKIFDDFFFAHLRLFCNPFLKFLPLRILFPFEIFRHTLNFAARGAPSPPPPLLRHWVSNYKYHIIINLDSRQCSPDEL